MEGAPKGQKRQNEGGEKNLHSVKGTANCAGTLFVTFKPPQRFRWPKC